MSLNLGSVFRQGISFVNPGFLEEAEAVHAPVSQREGDNLLADLQGRIDLLSGLNAGEDLFNKTINAFLTSPIILSPERLLTAFRTYSADNRREVKNAAVITCFLCSAKEIRVFKYLESDLIHRVNPQDLSLALGYLTYMDKRVLDRVFSEIDHENAREFRRMLTGDRRPSDTAEVLVDDRKFVDKNTYAEALRELEKPEVEDESYAKPQSKMRLSDLLRLMTLTFEVFTYDLRGTFYLVKGQKTSADYLDGQSDLAGDTLHNHPLPNFLPTAMVFGEASDVDAIFTSGGNHYIVSIEGITRYFWDPRNEFGIYPNGDPKGICVKFETGGIAWIQNSLDFSDPVFREGLRLRHLRGEPRCIRDFRATYASDGKGHNCSIEFYSWRSLIRLYAQRDESTLRRFFNTSLVDPSLDADSLAALRLAFPYFKEVSQLQV